MNVQEQIDSYIAGQPAAKQADIKAYQALMEKILPAGKLWFDDGRNEEGKIVTNPTIGYGSYTIKYADGKTKEFFQTGISTNASGISVYVMGVPDKTYLPQTFGEAIGKATVTGYCIKFKKLADINIDVLEKAIRYGIDVTKKVNQNLIP